MIEKFSSILKESVPFSRNPLGIFALIIIFTFPCVIGFSFFSGVLSYDQLWAVLVCMIVFLFSVIAMFFILITRHHTKLYGPGDFKDQEHFLQLATGKVKNRTEKYIQNAEYKGIQDGITRIPTEAVKLSEKLSRIIEKYIQEEITENDRKERNLLWVDDNPGNNVWEMMAFESIGISITTAKSTLEALYILEQREFVAIISDMGRQEGEREGYALLQEVRAREIAVPFFIYSSSDRPEHLKEAKDRGANATNNPLILYKMVVESLWS